MSKATKKDLQYQINGLAAEASTRHNSIMRIHRALASIGVDIFSDDFDLTEPEPQLKQLDQSVFDGLDEKWRFAAVDGNSRRYAYADEPRCRASTGRWVNNSEDEDCLYLGMGYDASNWQNSLIERDDIAKELLEVDLSSELMGSDLARAMLARGDKYVACLLSNDSEIHAKANDCTHVIRSFDESDCYFQAKYNRWQYAIPINNQGEPLTASEVGL